MDTQNFKNHGRLVPGFHYVAFSLLLAVLIGSIVMLFKDCGREDYFDAVLIVALTIATILVAWFTRVFSLKAQDRAIRAEENFRCYLATGKQLDSRLKMAQIIALRFAGDDEYVALSKRAADENLSAKDIKMSIKNWKADNYRV